MICEQLSSLLGFECIEISGQVARIETAFAFDDGDALPLYVQSVNGQIRFFDDGGVMLHFIGRGMSFEDGRKTRFIKTAAEPNGVVLNDAGELEVWASPGDPSQAFARYLSTLVSIVNWEREQRGANTDLTVFVDEVEMCLKAWKPGSNLVRAPQYEGVSGVVYTLDFNFDGEAIVATSAHPNSVSAAIKKLLDIRSSPNNAKLQMLVVIDDRVDEDAARRDSMVIQAVAHVMPYTTLEKHANKTYAGGNPRAS